MLKLVINIRESVDIREFLKLLARKETNSLSQEVKDSYVASVDYFLREATDDKYLVGIVKINIPF